MKFEEMEFDVVKSNKGIVVRMHRIGSRLEFAPIIRGSFEDGWLALERCCASPACVKSIHAFPLAKGG